MHQPNLYYITYRSRSVARPSTKSPAARTLFMDPQVLPTPLGFVISKLKIPRKRVLHFTNAVVKVLFRRQNKRSRVLSVSIFMFSFAHWNCTRKVILTPLLHLQHQLNIHTWYNFQHAHYITWSAKLISARAQQQSHCITWNSLCVYTVNIKFIFNI